MHHLYMKKAAMRYKYSSVNNVEYSPVITTYNNKSLHIKIKNRRRAEKRKKRNRY